MSTQLAAIRRVMTGETPRPRLAEVFGFDITGAQAGRVTMEFEIDEHHRNPMGTLHGGVISDIADSAMGMAFASQLEDGETFTTLELKVNFLRPVWSGRVRAIGRVVQAGKSVGMTECDVTDEQGRLVARATSTCMRLSGEKAAGRHVSWSSASAAG